MLAAWLAAFAVTQAVEVPIHATALRRAPRARPLPRRIALAFAASALTHPVVFVAFPALFPRDYWTGVAAAEAFAVGVEALYLGWLGVPRSIGWAALANGASFALGLGLRAAFGWP